MLAAVSPAVRPNEAAALPDAEQATGDGFSAALAVAMLVVAPPVTTPPAAASDAALSVTTGQLDAETAAPALADTADGTATLATPTTPKTQTTQTTPATAVTPEAKPAEVRRADAGPALRVMPIPVAAADGRADGSTTSAEATDVHVATPGERTRRDEPTSRREPDAAPWSRLETVTEPGTSAALPPAMAVAIAASRPAPETPPPAETADATVRSDPTPPPSAMTRDEPRGLRTEPPFGRMPLAIGQPEWPAQQASGTTASGSAPVADGDGTLALAPPSPLPAHLVLDSWTMSATPTNTGARQPNAPSVLDGWTTSVTVADTGTSQPPTRFELGSGAPPSDRPGDHAAQQPRQHGEATPAPAAPQNTSVRADGPLTLPENQSAAGSLVAASTGAPTPIREATTAERSPERRDRPRSLVPTRTAAAVGTPTPRAASASTDSNDRRGSARETISRSDEPAATAGAGPRSAGASAFVVPLTDAASDGGSQPITAPLASRDATDRQASPASGVVLLVPDDRGAPTRIHVMVRGESVTTRIIPASADHPALLAPVEELRGALIERGFNDVHVTVQAAPSAPDAHLPGAAASALAPLELTPNSRLPASAERTSTSGRGQDDAARNKGQDSRPQQRSRRERER